MPGTELLDTAEKRAALDEALTLQPSKSGKHLILSCYVLHSNVTRLGTHVLKGFTQMRAGDAPCPNRSSLTGMLDLLHPYYNDINLTVPPCAPDATATNKHKNAIPIGDTITGRKGCGKWEVCSFPHRVLLLSARCLHLLDAFKDGEMSRAIVFLFFSAFRWLCWRVVWGSVRGAPLHLVLSFSKSSVSLFHSSFRPFHLPSLAVNPYLSISTIAFSTIASSLVLLLPLSSLLFSTIDSSVLPLDLCSLGLIFGVGDETGRKSSCSGD
jgi:hypothetical protein